MTEISAADNHNVVIADGRWRLLYNDRPLAEASARGFRYSKRFGKTRRLPEDGIIGRDDIKQVVLGWQQTDESWHLGLILAPVLADSRGSRWCELTFWPDPEITVFQDLAQTTGQQLAQALSVPFYVIPPKQVIAPPAPPRKLPDLPVRFGDWEMRRSESDRRRFIIRRVPTWALGRVSRAMWYAIWAMIYLLLSVATLVSDIALPTTGTLLPSPELLPYLGLITSAWLLLAMLQQIYVILTSVNQITIDGARGVVVGSHNRRKHWAVPAVEIQSLYISEVVKKREQAPATEYGELNLHLGGGKFRFMVKQNHAENNSNIPQPDMIPQRTDGIRELNRNHIHTNLQTAAAYISQALGEIAVWHDVRVK